MTLRNRILEWYNII